MGSVNRTIIAAVVIIMATGLYKYYVIKSSGPRPPLTRLLIGGYMLALFASLFDLVGLGLGQLIGQILVLAAAGGALYVVVPDLVSKLGQQGTGQSTAGGHGTFK